MSEISIVNSNVKMLYVLFFSIPINSLLAQYLFIDKDLKSVFFLIFEVLKETLQITTVIMIVVQTLHLIVAV